MVLESSESEFDDVTAIRLTGRITLGEGTATLRKIVRGKVEGGQKKLVLQLADVTFIDSSGLGELVSSRAAALAAGGKIKLASLTQRTQDLLNLTKLNTIFDVFPDEQSAVQSFYSVLAPIALLASLFAGCGIFNPDYEARTITTGEVALILDSPRVQELVSRQSALADKDHEGVNRLYQNRVRLSREGNSKEADNLNEHAEDYIPDRIAFLDEMVHEPAATVERASYCRILERSEAICSRMP